MTKPSDRSKRSQTAIVHVEPLESRQLLSLTVEVRDAAGGHSATVNAVGQTLNLQVWANVTGANAVAAQDGLLDVIGSFITTGIDFGPVKGNL
ncbi:MAG TPA: hypothetical protein VLI90_18035, partial [Tepidisphaeraceae bacterium]|nr:hypothetical protein [Tepidisphaeraceae bacterium]